jgi:hypothetical protein
MAVARGQQGVKDVVARGPAHHAFLRNGLLTVGRVWVERLGSFFQNGRSRSMVKYLVEVRRASRESACPRAGVLAE